MFLICGVAMDCFFFGGGKEKVKGSSTHEEMSPNFIFFFFRGRSVDAGLIQTLARKGHAQFWGRRSAMPPSRGVMPMFFFFLQRRRVGAALTCRHEHFPSRRRSIASALKRRRVHVFFAREDICSIP